MCIWLGKAFGCSAFILLRLLFMLKSISGRLKAGLVSHRTLYMQSTRYIFPKLRNKQIIKPYVETLT
jgi:hypothetical protein